MRRRIVIALALGCIFSIVNSFAQQDQAASRKLVNRVNPVYPEVARMMGLKGSVKVEVLVGADGSVKSLQVKGGHPVLAQVTSDAIRKWKWVPATHESKEPVIVTFDPAH